MLWQVFLLPILYLSLFLQSCFLGKDILHANDGMPNRDPSIAAPTVPEDKIIGSVTL